VPRSHVATVRDARAESPTARTLVLDVPAWPGHRAGHHVDVRLTAEDGYQASRSYSIASAPEHDAVDLTIERFEDGEVSPYSSTRSSPATSSRSADQSEGRSRGRSTRAARST
jgi:ferredoxin-NADP reductase